MEFLGDKLGWYYSRKRLKHDWFARSQYLGADSLSIITETNQVYVTWYVVVTYQIQSNKYT